jgi:uncharacterized protein (TIGR02996 family)
MSERDALLAAIVAQPDDDAARLVYADWLQEHGQERRAQFIRAQVWAERAEPFGPEARKQARLAESLIEGFRGEWVRHLQQRLVAWGFRRGFVEHAEVNVATFARDAAELFRLEPIRSLRLVRFASGLTTVALDPFFEVPQLERVSRLDFTGFQLAPVELEPLAMCRHLANLTDLCLHAAPLLPNWLRDLLAGPVLPALAGLDLGDVTHLGPRLAEVLPTLAHRQFLRLDLSRITFTSAQLRAVLESRCLREVEELRLAWMPGNPRAGALSHLNPGWAIPWGRLRLIDLDGQGVGDDGVAEVVKALVRRPAEAPLRWLGLANNRIGSDAVRALVGAPESRLNLYHLDVRGNGLTLSQRHALQERFPEAEVKG